MQSWISASAWFFYYSLLLRNISYSWIGSLNSALILLKYESRKKVHIQYPIDNEGQMSRIKATIDDFGNERVRKRKICVGFLYKTSYYRQFFSAVFWVIDLKYGIWICHDNYNTDRVWVLSHLTYFCGSYCPLLKFSFPDFRDIDSKYSIWICNELIQIKFEFCEFRHALPTFTGVIALC